MKLAMQEQSDRRHGGSYVGKRQDWKMPPQCKQHDRERAADNAAMAGHAAVPELNDLDGIGGEMREIIEQHITDPIAEYDAERDPNDEIIQIGHAQRHRAAPQPWRRNNGARTKPTCDNPDDIGERVPAHREWADRNQDRIDCRKRNDRENNEHAKSF
jgi:hypothetical protein